MIAATAAISKQGGPFQDPVVATSQPQYDAPPTAGRVRAGTPGTDGIRASLVDPAWVRKVATSTGLPEAAVRAYGHATLRLGEEQPGCRLGWTTLAGIGSIESGHGTIGGRRLGSDGRSSSPILGPALDGRPGFAAIRSTPESTTWHGDATWDHAVGPLQFIPSTWSKWAADGDGDGSSDPNDIDDAAYAAGRYLCADGHRLDSDDWGRAIFSYNHSDDYVRAVHSAAVTYAARVGSGS
nr:lytic transglycosylase domain-containing protein [Nocardioides daedukensis]